MAVRKKFIDRFNERLDDLDSSSRQAYILRLAKERGFFETVFNAVDEGILVVDRNLKIRYNNRAARELLALPEDLSSLRISQLIQDIDWQQIIQQDNANSFRLARQEVEILYPTRKYIQIYLVPLPEEPELAAIMLRDVTESRKKTKSDLERETSQAVSLLASGVAHEIGNPLNSLYLNLQILEKSLDDKEIDRDDAREMLSVCKAEVERLDSIIHGFLSDLRPGQPEFSPVDIRELIIEVLKFMRAEIENRKISVNCSWQDVIIPVSADRKQLKQAFYNIIRNAAQAMVNGGTLNISGYAANDFFVLEFSDSGCGITPEQLSGVFKAFQSYKAGGNGIGMLVIEKVFRAHGADFGIISEPEKGTVFQVKFPIGTRRTRLLAAPGE
ncbi:MAG: PAS domain-containing protein [Lentisphaeria bacterium]|nr:PAS domain-containing protein [Lentisphaeria bacterium]